MHEIMHLILCCSSCRGDVIRVFAVKFIDFDGDGKLECLMLYNNALWYSKRGGDGVFAKPVYLVDHGQSATGSLSEVLPGARGGNNSFELFAPRSSYRNVGRYTISPSLDGAWFVSATAYLPLYAVVGVMCDVSGANAGPEYVVSLATSQLVFLALDAPGVQHFIADRAKVRQMWCVDMNGDGRMDILAAMTARDQVVIYFNSGNMSAWQEQIVDQVYSVTSVSTGNVTGRPPGQPLNIIASSAVVETLSVFTCSVAVAGRYSPSFQSFICPFGFICTVGASAPSACAAGSFCATAGISSATGECPGAWHWLAWGGREGGTAPCVYVFVCVWW